MYIMPTHTPMYHRMQQYNRRVHRRRGGAARSIQSAWRARKARKQSLLSRTAQANRKQIHAIKKSIETKVAENLEADSTSNYEGNYVIDLQADFEGSFTGGSGASAWNLLACKSLKAYSTGTTVNTDVDGRVGRWIQMKSLTLKYALYADENADENQNQRVFLYLVHDTQPDLNTPVIGDLFLSQATITPPTPATNINQIALAFQNLDQTGKKGRFKLLWKKMHILTPSSETNGYVNATVPPIVPAPAPATYGSARAGYTVHSSYAKGYPNHIYGSVTIAKPYKLNYGDDIREIVPNNQTIFLMMHSED
jgi:hypothetical protein